MRPTIDQQVTFLYTADLEKTAVFYENILELPLILDQESCRIYRVSEDAFLGFCQHLEAAPPSKSVILTLVSQEVDRWHTYLTTKNIFIEKTPQLNENFNIYHLFLRDPNGYLVEIQTFLDPLWPQAKSE